MLVEGLNDALAEVICDLRLKRKMTQAELASRTELTRPYVSDVERGLRNITIETLARFAGALGTTPSSLLKMSERTVIGKSKSR